MEGQYLRLVLWQICQFCLQKYLPCFDTETVGGAVESGTIDSNSPYTRSRTRFP